MLLISKPYGQALLPLRSGLKMLLVLWNIGAGQAQPIDRRAVVDRHRVTITQPDTLGSLTVGNGRFGFTVDATGLQSFPEQYARGIPLGTQSEWGWHRFPNPARYQFTETLQSVEVNGTPRPYAVQWRQAGRHQQAADYFRQNPHRLQLGNLGFIILKKDGQAAQLGDLKNVRQQLDLWTGTISSTFTVEGAPVSVTTCAHAQQDIVAVRVVSDLLRQQRISLRLRFPYPTNAFTDVGTYYASASAHQTRLERPGPTSVRFHRQLDQDRYSVTARLSQPAPVRAAAGHDFRIEPSGASAFEAVVQFSAESLPSRLPTFTEVQTSSRLGWERFWQSGGAIDLAGSTDPRAAELERRVVLSQYLTRVQCAGDSPPQETGLTYNSWYGRPHMEMYWWHSAHYALWGRTDLLSKSMGWYQRALAGAREIARRQGYRGVRWQKMTDPNGGETASSVGSFLIWQQPHPIYLAELIYRNQPSKAVLEQYRTVIFETADFMASFASLNPKTGRYDLGKGIIPAQECFDPAQTLNPPYELAYWTWGLQAAQRWRTRLNLPPNPDWQRVIDGLAPLPQQDGVYRAAENVTDSYSPDSRYTIDHPAVLAALSTLPANGVVDRAVMQRTYDTVDRVWHWDHTWGWDFPMVAMTATRLGQPDRALDALFKEVAKNTYLVNGHNYQDKRLTLYLPGNGGLLAAVALMCAGYDGNTTPTPGFPKNGRWMVKWEGLKPMP
ncbi:hypothetical protein [Spirosoma sp. 209]|uniref:hypothetical protein n=1 Tax=Spirosoma sp. 209 TaxID=1955701 RepID=UPI00098D25E1|nr:hypothetical protein [Spirosoma sp. 209]